ncbi:MAG: CBS domain-containing protein [Anaerolineae bacterium]|nr:CBS domain-containing protein [Anaerolineae bacterium]
MLVKDRMTKRLISISPDTPVAEALSFMRQNSIRRLPVLNKRGRLVGIVTEKELLHASPSPATTLSIYEIGYLLSKLKVEEIMTRDLVTVSPEAPLEEAARLMADNKVAGLPVMDGKDLVGIITETDIFKVFLEMMGARESGIRLTLKVPNQPGVLSRIAAAISAEGGDIISLGTFFEDERKIGTLVIKVSGVDKNVLIQAMEKIEAHVTDVRVN